MMGLPLELRVISEQEYFDLRLDQESTWRTNMDGLSALHLLLEHSVSFERIDDMLSIASQGGPLRNIYCWNGPYSISQSRQQTQRNQSEYRTQLIENSGWGGDILLQYEGSKLLNPSGRGCSYFDNLFYFSREEGCWDLTGFQWTSSFAFDLKPLVNGKLYSPDEVPYHTSLVGIANDERTLFNVVSVANRAVQAPLIKA